MKFIKTISFTTCLVLAVVNKSSFAQIMPDRELSFNGTSDFVNLGLTVANNIRTIEFSFVPTNTIDPTISVDGLTFVGRNDATQTNEFGIYIRGTDWAAADRGNIRFFMYDNGTFNEVVSDVDTWQAGVCHHVCGVIHPTNGMMLFIDGILQTSTNISTTSIPSAPEITTIGKWGNANIRYFDGQMDNLRFWSSALTQQQIHVNQCNVIDPTLFPNLIGEWRMDDNTAPATLVDEIGTGVGNNPGVINGATYVQGFNQCENWNITNSSTVGNSIGNDIITDNDGNVYVAGTFDQDWTFDLPLACSTGVNSVTITGVGANPRSAYLAKYNSCGDLLWVNFESAAGFSEGHSLAYDGIRNVVYMAGQATNLIGFFTTAVAPCGNTPIIGTPVTNGTLHKPYLAKFDAATGAFIDGRFNPAPIAGAPTVSYFSQVHIACENTTTTSSKVYYTYAYETGSSDRVVVGALTNTGSTYTGLWENVSGMSASRPRVNDIAIYHEGGGLYITGSYQGVFRFTGVPPITASSSLEFDAYIARFNLATGAPTALKKFGTVGTSAGHEETIGTSITVNEFGQVFFVGRYNKATSSIFGSSLSVNLPSAPLFGTYLVRFDAALSTVAWARRIYSSTGDVRGTGIASFDGELYVTGTLMGSITEPAVLIPNGVYSGTGGSRVFVVHGDAAGSPTGAWANTTMDVLSSDHISTRIAVGMYYTYTTGSYIGTLDYTNSSTPFGPASGPLNSAGPLSRNTFVMRNENSTGEFRAQEESDIYMDKENDLNIQIFPNPTSSVFQINAGSNIITSIRVTDVTGKIIKIAGNVNSTRIEIDMQGENFGIYLVETFLENANQSIKSRLVLQN